MAGGFKADTHWRDSARSARFWVFDANACFPILFALLHIAVWTICLAIVATFFFTMLNRRGYTVTVFFRVLRTYIAGPRKQSRPWWI
ncbi:MAG: IcmT/TraK family protein [Legionellales bacterium]|nr:IcmT/TraK family protein [Legionellales bacterium]